MIHIGGFYRLIKNDQVLVKVLDLGEDFVVVGYIGGLAHIGTVTYPMNYFVNAYELDG